MFSKDEKNALKKSQKATSEIDAAHDIWKNGRMVVQVVFDNICIHLKPSEI